MKNLKNLLLIAATTIAIVFYITSCNNNDEKENIKPSCTITSPADASEVAQGEEITIKVNAQDPDGSIHNVEFFIDGNSMTTVSRSPYEYKWNTTSFAAGEHEIKATAKDNKGASNADVITIQLTGGSITQGDTVYPGNILNASGFTMYTVNDQDGQYAGYLTGVNAFQDQAKAQHFIVNDEGYKIKGAMYWFGNKYVDGNGNLKFNLWDMDGTNGTSTEGEGNQTCPGTVLASKELAIADVDTAAYLSDSHVQLFDSAIEVTNDYAMGIDIEGLYSNNDTIALVTSLDGDGNNMELSWEQWSDGTWKTLMYSYGNLDVDIAIFPLLASEAANVPDGNFIFGMKMSSSQKSIKSDAIIIDYELEKASSQVILEIYDILGNQLYHHKLGTKKAGTHTAKAFVKLHKGKYVYVLHANGKKLAKELVVN